MEIAPLYTNFWALLFISLLDRNLTKNWDWQNDSQLILVQAIIRHGERNPQFLIPSDSKNSISTWFQGSLGELTPRGMHEVHTLGVQFGQKYRNFLNLSLAAKQVYMRSTDRNRTLTSAYGFLGGLLEGHLGVSVSKLPKYYQPIPVHTIYGPSDSVVLVDTYCQKAIDILQKRVWKTKEWTDTVKNNEEFISWLSSKSQVKNLTLDQLWKVVDPLTIQMNYPKLHPWPDWVNSSILQRVQALVDFVTLRKYHRQSLARLRGGQLLGELLGRMEQKIRCSNANGTLPDHSCSWISDLKFYAYSAHESTLLATLETLVRGEIHGSPAAAQLTNGSFPKSGATLLMELWKNNGKYLVKILYKNTYKLAFKTVWVSEGCEASELCQFDILKLRSQKFIPDNWKKECSGANSVRTKGKIDKPTSMDFVDVPMDSISSNMSLRLRGHTLTAGATKKTCRCTADTELLMYKYLSLVFGVVLAISVYGNLRSFTWWHRNTSWLKLKI